MVDSSALAEGWGATQIWWGIIDKVFLFKPTDGARKFSFALSAEGLKGI